MAAKRGKSQAKRTQGNGGGVPGWAWGVAGLLLGIVLILVVPKYLKSDGDGFFRPHPNPDAQPAPVESEPDVVDEAARDELPTPAAATRPEKKNTDFDFYTMLPGKEVPLSDAELAATAKAEAQRDAAQQGQATAAVPAGPSAPTGASGAEPSAGTTLPAPVSTDAEGSTRTTTAPAATPAPAATAPPATTKPSADASPDTARYLLQAGAFEASGQAEELKARIALLGLGARVESARIGGKTVYRVRMGPYGTASELAEAKRKLAGGGVPGMAIKVE